MFILAPSDSALKIDQNIFSLIVIFKLFALEFSFTFACLVFGRQALTLLNR
ncbi:MAG: hypothetical protein LBP59_18830 [Planctomycetaceae bacterium]|nr:hypothetical protein [Planctomycetaceae bacterium]